MQVERRCIALCGVNNVDWLLECPIIQLLEDLSPSTLDEVDGMYVESMKQFIHDAKQENQTHYQKIGTYRLDLFVAGQFAKMKLKTYLEAGLDPDAEEGQLYMIINYWSRFSQEIEKFLPYSSEVTITDEQSWQSRLQSEFI